MPVSFEKLIPDIHETCPICLIAFTENDSVAGHVIKTSIKVNHAFHRSCIGPWFDLHDFCPMCRVKISNSQYYNTSLVITPFDRSVRIAAAEGDLLRLQNLLDQENISEEIRGIAVCDAANKGRFQVVQFLLNEPISNLYRGIALIAAAEIGNLPIERILFTNQLSENHKSWALMNAARHGHRDVVQFLVDCHAQIPDRDREWLLSEVRKKGYNNVMEILPGQ